MRAPPAQALGKLQSLTLSETELALGETLQATSLQLDGRGRPSSIILFAVEAFFDCDFAVFLYGDDFMNALKSRQRDVEHVVARIEVQVYRGIFIKNAVIDRDLSALGRRFDADCAHSGSVTVAKELLELAAHFDVIGVAQRLQALCQADGLPCLEIRRGAFIEVALLLEHEAVISGAVHGELRGSDAAGIFAIHPDSRSR